MNIEKISLKLREIKLRRIYVYYFFYLFAVFSIIIQLVYRYENVYPLTLIILGFAVILRIVNIFLNRRMVDEPEKVTTDWKSFRKQLTQILTESKILLDSAIELRSDEVSSVIISEEQINGLFFKENEKMIETIRKIGADGLLCLIFLIQQQPAIASVKAIQKSLKLPIASAYRHLKKLSTLELVVTYFYPDKPNKALYKITDEGSSLIINLYELLGGSMIPSIEGRKTKIEAET